MPELIEPTSKRLRLCGWQERHYAPFAELNADERVMLYFPAPLSRQQSDAMIEKCLSKMDTQGFGFWAVERQAPEHNDGWQFIGMVGLNVVADNLPFAPAVEVGWRLCRHAWGQGYASEAARASLAVAFEQRQFDEVVSFTPLQNKRSQATMERIGMTRDNGSFNHPALDPGHPLGEHCLYRISARAYAAGLA